MISFQLSLRLVFGMMTSDSGNELPPSDIVKEDFFDLSACWECAVKHVTSARIEYFEYLPDNSSIRDLMWCIGDLACAEKHLLYLDTDLADAVRVTRKGIMGKNIPLGDFDQVVLLVCSMSGLFKDRN